MPILYLFVFSFFNKQTLTKNNIHFCLYSLYVTTSVYPVPSICALDQISDWFDSLAECLHWNVRKKQKQMDELSDMTHSSSDTLEEIDTNHHDDRSSDT